MRPAGVIQKRRISVAAIDMFELFNASLSKKEADSVRELVQLRRRELLVARSEDARLRLAQEYIEEVRKIFKSTTGH
jgi:hypothetical protein